MDAETVRLAILVGGTVVTGLVWLLRLEGRINTNDAIIQALTNDLRYIRSRIDAALNGHDDR